MSFNVVVCTNPKKVVPVTKTSSGTPDKPSAMITHNFTQTQQFYQSDQVEAPNALDLVKTKNNAPVGW